MSELDFEGIEEQADKQQADTDILSENKVEDLVRYCRGKVIANEEQFVLGALAKVTGWIRTFSTNVNFVYIGPSSGGKSHVQHALIDILPSEVLYEVSDSSNLAVVDDDDWEDTLVAPLDEWQKIPDKVTEIIKSVAGEDIKYTYARNVQDDESESGRKTVKMHKYAKPYSFLYAQFSMDSELWNRLLKLYVDDDERIHRAIGKMQAGHDHISVTGFENDYIYDVSETESAIRQHIRELPSSYEDLDGKERLTGDSFVQMPRWVWYATEPIFNHQRTETNRIYAMVFNSIRASALINHDARETVQVEREGEEVEAVVVAPQDVANILSARETLLGTTHELEKRKRKIVEAVRSHSGLGDDAGCTIDTIESYLDSDKSQMSVPKKQELRDILQELEDNYVLRIREHAGPNGAHIYEFRSLKQIAVPRITNLTNEMPSEEIEADAEYVSDSFDFDAPFEDCHDPFRDQLFTETVVDLEQKYSDSAVERAERTAEMASDDDDDGELDIGEAMGGTETLTDPLEATIYERLGDSASGETFSGSATEAHLLGIVPEGKGTAEVDTSGTLLDPTHDVWDRPDKPDGWVDSQGDVQAQIEDTVSDLSKRGVIEYNVTSDGVEIGLAEVNVNA